MRLRSRCRATCAAMTATLVVAGAAAAGAWAQVIPPPSTATWHPRHFLINDEWYRFWRETAGQRRAFLERVQRLLSAGFDITLAFVARLAFGSDEGADSRPAEGHYPVARRRRSPRWAHRPRAK